MISGCINMTGVLKVRTTKQFEESTVSKILELVENSGYQEIKIRTFYLQIRQSVYSGSLLRGIGAGTLASGNRDGLSRTGGSVGRVDLQSSYIPCD